MLSTISQSVECYGCDMYRVCRGRFSWSLKRVKFVILTQETLYLKKLFQTLNAIWWEAPSVVIPWLTWQLVWVCVMMNVCPSVRLFVSPLVKPVEARYLSSTPFVTSVEIFTRFVPVLVTVTEFQSHRRVLKLLGVFFFSFLNVSQLSMLILCFNLVYFHFLYWILFISCNIWFVWVGFFCLLVGGGGGGGGGQGWLLCSFSRCV